jgi:hypothetical protein
MEHEIGAREAARELGLTGEAMLAAAAASADTEAALEQNRHQFSSSRGLGSKHGGGSSGGGGGVRPPVSSATAAALAVVAVGRQPTMNIASSQYFCAGRWTAVRVWGRPHPPRSGSARGGGGGGGRHPHPPHSPLFDCSTVAMIRAHGKRSAANHYA